MLGLNWWWPSLLGKGTSPLMSTHPNKQRVQVTWHLPLFWITIHLLQFAIIYSVEETNHETFMKMQCNIKKFNASLWVSKQRTLKSASEVTLYTNNAGGWTYPGCLYEDAVETLLPSASTFTGPSCQELSAVRRLWHCKDDKTCLILPFIEEESLRTDGRSYNAKNRGKQLLL
jgi:hypothetical protein